MKNFIDDFFESLPSCVKSAKVEIQFKSFEQETTRACCAAEPKREVTPLYARELTEAAIDSAKSDPVVLELVNEILQKVEEAAGLGYYNYWLDSEFLKSKLNARAKRIAAAIVIKDMGFTVAPSGDSFNVKW